MIILKVPKDQGSTLYLEDVFPKRHRGREGVKLTPPPSPHTHTHTYTHTHTHTPCLGLNAKYI